MALALVLGLAATDLARADPLHLAAPAPGVVETGVPSFVVMGPESAGLEAAPSDLHLLDDGRVLLVSPRTISFGDGARWETFRAAPGVPDILGGVQFGPKGEVYFGVNGGIGRAVIGADGLWHNEDGVTLPSHHNGPDSTPSNTLTVDGQWYWFAGSGTVCAWNPGQAPRVVARASSLSILFRFHGTLFGGEQSSGRLFRVMPDGTTQSVAAVDSSPSETITCQLAFDPDHLLVGTALGGLQLFDGTRLTPFVAHGPLARGSGVNDLCALGGGLYAAAIDTFGIVFFDRSGRIVQTLEHTLDHRLSRVKKLVYDRNGVVWGLLNEGIVRVEFPSRVSHYEALVQRGLTFARPVRHAGELWLIADGISLRGVYTSDGRLTRFDDDAPPGRFVFNLVEVDGDLFASNERGMFVRTPAGWSLVLRDAVNARPLVRTAAGLLYAARGEYGVLEKTDTGYVAHRIERPDLGDNYEAVTDAKGIVWLELGNSSAARLDPHPAIPELRIFGTESGLPDGWVELYIFEGTLRAHVPNHLMRFDDATGRFVADAELLQRFPDLLLASGRPVTDVNGRLWYSTSVGTKSLDPRNPSAPPVLSDIGFGASSVLVQDDGIVWFFMSHRLARFDPRLPEPAITTPVALITSVQFASSGRSIVSPGPSLGRVDYSDNSLSIHFAAPSNTFSAPVSFEVMLEGAGSHWISMGAFGQAAFSRLKEGDYVFHVRPFSARTGYGREAQLAFTVRPPWYRTSVAWFVYGLSGLAVVAFASWFSSYLQRRENDRLELLVEKRTEELNNINVQLGRQIEETTEKSTALVASEERYRTLNADLERRVVERTSQLSCSNAELLQRESQFRLIFEHAPVGVSWRRADLDGQYHFNTTYRRILALPAATLPDRSSLDALIHPEDAPRHTRLAELLAAGKVDNFSIEARYVLPTQHLVWGSLSVAVTRDADGRVVQDIGIFEDVTARKQAESQLATTYKELVDASRMAGMAEVATGVLHNVGNVLNSLNVSANLLLSNVRQSKAESLVKLSTLLNERAATLGDFLTHDPKGRLVPELLSKLAQAATAERDWLLQEITSMQQNIDHIKDIVAMQQSYATVIGVIESLEPSSLLEDALRMNTAALLRHDVQVIREYLPVQPVSVEKGKVLQILINVIRNAKYACDDGQQQFGQTEKIITVRVEPGENDRVRLIVRDNGIGIAPENLTRIFAHGFTTRAYGHGFGLHSSVLAAHEMNGTLTAHSDGLGKGATFVLELPTSLATDDRSINTPRIAMRETKSDTSRG